MSSVDTMDVLESNIDAKPKALDSSFDSRLQKKLQQSQKFHSSNASVDSEVSQPSVASSHVHSRKSHEDSPPSGDDTSFKLKLKSQLAQGKSVETGDDLSLDEKIKIKKGKSSSSSKKR